MERASAQGRQQLESKRNVAFGLFIGFPPEPPQYFGKTLQAAKQDRTRGVAFGYSGLGLRQPLEMDRSTGASPAYAGKIQQFSKAVADFWIDWYKQFQKSQLQKINGKYLGKISETMYIQFRTTSSRRYCWSSFPVSPTSGPV